MMIDITHKSSERTFLQFTKREIYSTLYSLLKNNGNVGENIAFLSHGEIRSPKK